MLTKHGGSLLRGRQDCLRVGPAPPLASCVANGLERSKIAKQGVEIKAPEQITWQDRPLRLGHRLVFSVDPGRELSRRQRLASFLWQPPP